MNTDIHWTYIAFIGDRSEGVFRNVLSRQFSDCVDNLRSDQPRSNRSFLHIYFYVLVCVLDFFVCVLDFLFMYWSLAWAVNGTCQPCTRLRLRFVYFNILGVIHQGSWCFLHCFFLFRVWCCLGVRHCHPSSREKTQRAKKWKRQSWSWNGASKTGKFTTVGLFNWENACSSKILRTAITLEFFLKMKVHPNVNFPV